MPTGTILLFDIDGTLLDSGGTGRRALRAAFDERFGRPDACDLIPFGGMTDRAIVRRAHEAIGQPCPEDAIDELLRLYLPHLARETSPPRRATLLPGVTEALDRAAAAPRLCFGLGTGNIRAAALLKLRMVGLDERFAFGGFGCDAEPRHELLRAGAERGALRLGLPLASCRVVVIGDTPRDIEAAHAIGASCLAVATGGFTREQLAAHAPALCCADLTDPAAGRFLFSPA